MAPIIADILGTASETQISVSHKHVVTVDHAGVAVSGFDAAIEWYRASLGFISYHDEVNGEQGVHEAMVNPVDKAEGDTLVQIPAPLSDQSTITKYLDKRGSGIQQYVVRVTDLEALVTHLKEQGTCVLYPEPKTGTAGSRIDFIHPKNASGALLELVEPVK